MSFPDGTPWLVGWMGTRAGRKGEDDDGDDGKRERDDGEHSNSDQQALK